jgi:hypothetical protein
MGTPDGFFESPAGTMMLDLKTVKVEGKSRPLPTVRELNPRFPRKLKKKLKKYHGSEYHNWLNSRIKYVVDLDNLNIYSYHSVDAEKELTEMLEKELQNETNKRS